MKLYIDTDDEIEGVSSAIADVLVNLKKESPPPNLTGLGSPEIISPEKFFKLQTKNAHLKENLHEYEVLDRFLKTKNTTLKGHLAQSRAQESEMCAQLDKFHSQANTLSFENRKLQSRLNRRYQETHILLIENKSLRKQLHSTGQEVENEADQKVETEAIPDTT
jgi:regulator of replication initiation timing